MRKAWEALIRDFVRHLKGTNRSESTQRIYRRAATGLIDFLQATDQLVSPNWCHPTSSRAGTSSRTWHT
jgi:hypothetical protein